jgi:cell cycle checkpoint protein
MDEDERPVLTAVSSSARQLFMLLRCIAFSNKAHVTINEEGLKLSVNEVSAMEGILVFDPLLTKKKLMRNNSIHLPPQIPFHNLHLSRPHLPAQPRNI